MKSFAYPLAILIVAATAMASTASAGGAAEDLHQIKARVDANMAEKKRLRALDAPPADAREFKDMQKFVRENEQASDGGQQLQFEIQMQTSEMTNADASRTTKESKMRRVLKALDGAQPAQGTAIGGAVGGHASEDNKD